MKTYLIGTTKFDAGNNTQIKLEYYLTEEIRDIETSSALYGVEVKKEIRNKNGIFLEQERATSLSYSRTTVENLIHILLLNTVTPMNLLEIVDDYITKEGLSA